MKAPISKKDLEDTTLFESEPNGFGQYFRTWVETQDPKKLEPIDKFNLLVKYVTDKKNLFVMMKQDTMLKDFEDDKKTWKHFFDDCNNLVNHF